VKRPAIPILEQPSIQADKPALIQPDSLVEDFFMECDNAILVIELHTTITTGILHSITAIAGASARNTSWIPSPAKCRHGHQKIPKCSTAQPHTYRPARIHRHWLHSHCTSQLLSNPFFSDCKNSTIRSALWCKRTQRTAALGHPMFDLQIEKRHSAHRTSALGTSAPLTEDGYQNRPPIQASS